MTGEITLKGRVLPVGGLKEKLLGAKRAGLRKVIVPAANSKEIDDIPDEIKRGMTVVYVDHLDDVLPNVFPSRKRRAASPTVKRQAKRSVERVKKPAAAKRPRVRKPRGK